MRRKKPKFSFDKAHGDYYPAYINYGGIDIINFDQPFKSVSSLGGLFKEVYGNALSNIITKPTWQNAKKRS